MSPRQNLVFDGAPFCELAEVVDDALRVGAKVVRPIVVDLNTSIVVMIIGVASDVSALIDNEARLAELARDALGQDRAGEPGAHDEKIKFGQREVEALSS